MPTLLIINNGRNSTPFLYDSQSKTFNISEKDTKFDTEYFIRNAKTGGEVKFTFSHSTGSEFDPNTKWIYFSLDKQITLIVSNDPYITCIRARNYLNAKLGK
jgi:hypothetical protein